LSLPSTILLQSLHNFPVYACLSFILSISICYLRAQVCAAKDSCLQRTLAMPGFADKYSEEMYLVKKWGDSLQN
jgi:hypothetical protein